MIQFHVISVTRKTSAELWTIRYTYENDQRKSQRIAGAEWEEIEFREEIFDQPTIQIANITGNFILTGNPKLIINDPTLFGTYKIGDIIEFMPLRVKEELAKAN